MHYTGKLTCSLSLKTTVHQWVPNMKGRKVARTFSLTFALSRMRVRSKPKAAGYKCGLSTSVLCPVDMCAMSVTVSVVERSDADAHQIEISVADNQKGELALWMLHTFEEISAAGRSVETLCDGAFALSVGAIEAVLAVVIRSGL
eukprot:1160002-Pelagomonas_calceolata.AAC.7